MMTKVRPREDNRLMQGHTAHGGRTWARTHDSEPSGRGPSIASCSECQALRQWKGWHTWFISSDSDSPMNQKGIKIPLRAYKCSWACVLSPNLIRIIPTSPSERPQWESQSTTASLSILRQAWEQRRAAFLFPGCSPCNLEVQTVTPENRKKNRGALKIKLSVGSPTSSKAAG